MGLIKAVVGSVATTLSETWKDYFVCDALDNETLLVRGVKRGNGGSGEIISNGSGIVVNEGQCALVVDEGKIVEVAAEPGNYTFDTSKSPSIFDGGFKGIKDTFSSMISMFTYGGEVNRNQRVYYVNTKEIMGNLFGTAQPIPFRIIDKNLNLDVEMPIRCNGEYSYKITNPLVFFTNISGNEKTRFTKDDLASQMKAEMLSALQPAFASIAAQGIRYYEVAGHIDELTKALNEALNVKWTENRGISFKNIAINSVSMDEENEKKLRDLQLSAVNKDVNMAAATMTQATADAMRDAANNANGAMAGFMGINMAQGVGGVNANGLFEQAAKNQNAQGQANFCSKCGQPVKPEDNFCPSCGNKLK